MLCYVMLCYVLPFDLIPGMLGHGIPDSRPLESGDIVNVDISVYYKGFHADLNETFCVGVVEQKYKDLIKCTHDALMKALEAVQPGALFRDFGEIITKTTGKAGYSVVRSYCQYIIALGFDDYLFYFILSSHRNVSHQYSMDSYCLCPLLYVLSSPRIFVFLCFSLGGHGIGSVFHTTPSIPHYSRNKAVGQCKPGMVFTIEPMINMGTWKDCMWTFDDWTVVTTDGKRSAQFEHTVLVTEKGVEILTARTKDSPPLCFEPGYTDGSEETKSTSAPASGVVEAAASGAASSASVAP